MGGYYTSSRRDDKSRNATMRSSLFPNGGYSQKVQVVDRHTVTSYRTRRRQDDVAAPPNYGARDPFESYYAYGSWRHDTGHPFSVDHVTYKLTHPRGYAAGQHTSNAWVTYRGPLIPDYGSYGGDPLPIQPINSPYWGARLIRMAAPTNPVASVSQTLAELVREGVTLPGAQFIRALRSRTGFLRSVGSEYLNVEFGWAPLVRDLESVMKAVLQSRIILENLEKNSGKDVRRRRVLDEVVLKTEYSVFNNVSWRPPTAGASDIVNSIFAGYPAGPLKNVGQLERIDRVTEQYSFSGAFTYFFENGSDPIQKLRAFEQRANALLGVRVLTPEVLWELAPWSWLADYFANFGTLAGNASRFSQDGLVMKYGYLMRHSVSTRTYTQNAIAFRSGGPGPFAISISNEKKERMRATPYGFGLNPNSFTTRQWAILAALGLTRAPRTLP